MTFYDIMLKRKFSMPNIFGNNGNDLAGSNSIMTRRHNSSKGHTNLVFGTGIGEEEEEYCSSEYSPPSLPPSSGPLEFILPTSSSRFNVGKKSHIAGASVHSSTNKKGKEKKKSHSKSTNNLHSVPSPEPKLSISKIDVAVLKEWETSFNSLLKHPDGVVLFENFLVSEFSEENIQFWKACERFASLPDEMIEKEASLLYEEYVGPQAPKLVNIDHQTTREIIESMKNPDKSTFIQAQQSIYLLMARDSFVRFIKAESFQSALKR